MVLEMTGIFYEEVPENFDYIRRGMMCVKERNVYVPFRDPQQQRPSAFCPVCGREVYGAGGECLYCLAHGV